MISWIDHTNLPSESANYWGGKVRDEVFFATDRVYCVGQPIGMIVAETKAQARAAARAVVIQYGAEFDPILTIEDAIARSSFFPMPREVVSGDIERAMRNATYVFTGRSRMGGQEQFYLETNAALAVPNEGGEMEIYSSTQNPSET